MSSLLRHQWNRDIRLGSPTDPLLPDEKEGEEDEFDVFDYFVGNVEIHASWCFSFEETSTASDLAVGFGNYSLSVTVYKLEGVSE